MDANGNPIGYGDQFYNQVAAHHGKLQAWVGANQYNAATIMLVMGIVLLLIVIYHFGQKLIASIAKHLFPTYWTTVLTKRQTEATAALASFQAMTAPKTTSGFIAGVHDVQRPMGKFNSGWGNGAGPAAFRGESSQVYFADSKYPTQVRSQIAEGGLDGVQYEEYKFNCGDQTEPDAVAQAHAGEVTEEDFSPY